MVVCDLTAGRRDSSNSQEFKVPPVQKVRGDWPVDGDNRKDDGGLNSLPLFAVLRARFTKVDMDVRKVASIHVQV